MRDVSGYRVFTRAEDELIVRQSQGEFEIRELRKMIHANMTTITRRADELGVKVFIKPHNHGRRAGTFPSTWDDPTPAKIRNDRLLKKLREVHG